MPLKEKPAYTCKSGSLYSVVYIHTLRPLFQKLRLPSAVITLDCLQSVWGDVHGILL